MVSKGLMWRVALPTFGTAAMTSGVAVAITYATTWRDNAWAWVIVGVLTLLGAGVSVWLYFQQQGPDTADASGVARLTIRGKNKIGTVQADASRNAEVVVGRKSSLDMLQVTAGIQSPQADRRTPDSPQRRPRGERGPAMSDDDGQDVV
jgi:hypothetical protein